MVAYEAQDVAEEAAEDANAPVFPGQIVGVWAFVVPSTNPSRNQII